MKLSIIVLSFIFLVACGNKQDQYPQGKWIIGTEQEKLETIENQFRGFDMAMVETGYRYQELYWAGQDGNWEYADYQIEKIRIAIENGLVRRPDRAKSAEHFLNVGLPDMSKALEQSDTVVFNNNFQMITNHCNVCHTMEEVPHFHVQKPLYRQSLIRKN